MDFIIEDSTFKLTRRSQLILSRFFKYEPWIIGGCHRSGTTLLRRILDSHSRIYCGPEVKFFVDFFNDYSDDHLAHVRFFSSLKKLDLDNNEILRIFARAYIECIEKAAIKNHKKRWVEKTPENILYLDVWEHLLGGKFKFIFMVRNPLDTVAAMEEVQFSKTFPASFENKVLQCKKYLNKGCQFMTHSPESTYVVKYEDLVLNTRHTVAGLMEAMGEKFEEEMITVAFQNNRIGGLGDPKAKKTNYIHAESINRWSRDLTPEQVVYAKQELSSVCKSLGYDP